MKQAVARGLFIAASLVVASAAAASWQQSDMRVMSSLDGAQLPIKSTLPSRASADQDLLLFILGLQQNRSTFQ